ncbi:hypothetical protein RvY_02190-2 [Ramazzottius varieornatus]|uniref:Uncharacterized protein n=1 Tax=Ramazzottius varieornatus TaxID=947166 RepID=A0A1D1UIV2_RAMVA|nr:hypothetical protein RvY_02190-2 [Ramazzottius varieornatus]
MALTLDMNAVTTTKKWDVDDGVSYAKVMIITASKNEAEGLRKPLDEQARKAIKIAPKKPSGPLSPPKIQNERDFKSELVCESADGQHVDEDEAWVSESAGVGKTERSASPQLQLAQTLDRPYCSLVQGTTLWICSWVVDLGFRRPWEAVSLLTLSIRRFSSTARSSSSSISNGNVSSQVG